MSTIHELAGPFRVESDGTPFGTRVYDGEGRLLEVIALRYDIAVDAVAMLTLTLRGGQLQITLGADATLVDEP